MERYTQKQLIAVAAGVAAVVSLVASFGTVVFLSHQAPSSVVERIIGSATSSAPQAAINEKILNQDELVVGAVKAASPSVVSVVASKDVPVVEQYFVNPFPNDPFFQQFFGQDFGVPQYRQKGTQRQDVSSGSGFVVSPDGLILTNKHVVSDTQADYTVFLNDGTKLPASVLARDPLQDFAILKVTPPKNGLVPLILGDSDAIQVGQTVIAIGNALGEFRNTVSVGIVSGLERSIVAQSERGAEELQSLIQTDAAINPGNSGGPLLNLRGEVVGIDTAMASGAQNIGFALPINKAKRDIQSIKQFGRIVYPFLGVQYVLVTKDMVTQYKLGIDYGALLAKGRDGSPAIVAGSPAEKAGLKEGDVILMVNGEKIDADHTLVSYLLKYNPGDTVTLTVFRDGGQRVMPVTLVERK